MKNKEKNVKIYKRGKNGVKMELKEIEKANTKYLGKKVIYYEEIESTHKKAKELATSKTENGTIIIADKQTGGIGTKGRSWYTGNNRNCKKYAKCNKRIIQIQLAN